MRGNKHPVRTMRAAVMLSAGCFNWDFSAQWSLGDKRRYRSPNERAVKQTISMSYAKTAAKKLCAGVAEYGEGFMARTGTMTRIVVSIQ
jgi:type IV pilus biogenesis protein CpaD/CtpE